MKHAFPALTRNFYDH